MQNEREKLGIGFATGRKGFKRILNSYAHSYLESGIPENPGHPSLNLYVAYDTQYSNTISTDYTNLPQEIVDIFDNVRFFGVKSAFNSLDRYIRDGAISQEEAKLLFGNGYAGKRNILLLAAIESGMDYLLYLDDDEYPLAVTKRNTVCEWSGQELIVEHLRHIQHADITHGYHCGYISPIPQITFDGVLTQERFRLFIQAISNDIINWETIKEVIANGGVTYARRDVLLTNDPVSVEEEHGCKFISGSNLCLNLKNPKRSFPFYNPPGARGEDTFMSTLLTNRKVLRIPCYAFHDGFSTYKHLLYGVLPIRLKPITIQTPNVTNRFYRACLGWARYKPLLVYLTDPANFKIRMVENRLALSQTLPFVAEYFGENSFLKIVEEFDQYARNAPRHAMQFVKTQDTWAKLISVINV